MHMTEIIYYHEIDIVIKTQDIMNLIGFLNLILYCHHSITPVRIRTVKGECAEFSEIDIDLPDSE